MTPARYCFYYFLQLGRTFDWLYLDQSCVSSGPCVVATPVWLQHNSLLDPCSVLLKLCPYQYLAGLKVMRMVHQGLPVFPY